MAGDVERVVIAVPDALSHAEVVRLAQQVAALQRRGKSVVCDVQGSDLGVVDALARIHLVARSSQLHVSSTARVADMLALTGLSEVCRQPEALEEGEVEEVVDVGDPTV